MIIVLIGPPGSGKGTQGIFLSKNLRLPHISIGEIFRNKIHQGDEDGIELNKYIKSGDLAPSELVNRIVKSILNKPEYSKGCILDGYPRNLDQAKYLEDHSLLKIYAVCLEVESEVAINRVLHRYGCALCGAIYSNLTKSENEICENCGAKEFISRRDDNLETVRNRIEVYRTETSPVIDYYKSKNNLILIDAGKNTHEVSSSLLAHLKKV